MRSKYLEITPYPYIMKFVTSCVVAAGKTNTINFPNLTKRSLIPIKLTITEQQDGEEVPINGCLARVHAGGLELCNCGEPTFKLTNELDLSMYKGLVERTGVVSITITNRTTGVKRLKLYSEYASSYGGVLLEEKTDHCENLLHDIHAKGFCTKLVISFNKQADVLEFANTAECLEGKWLEPFSIPIDNELDVDDQIYTIDFTSEDLGAEYSENLNFLEARATAKKSENDKEPLYMYVTAFGFPYQN